MKLVIVILGLVVIGTLAETQEPQNNQVEEVKDGDAVMTITHGNKADIVERRDKDGNHLSTTELLFSMDLEIEKPIDRNVCLLMQASTNATCFDEVPAQGSLADDILESCKGREIWILKPADCDNESVGSDGDELSRQLRHVRNECCRYNCFWKTESYCCKKFWYVCIKTCYKTTKACSRKCVTGAISRY